MEPPRSRLSFGALRRVDRAALRPRALTRPPPPPERRFIASPRLRQGIVAGQINELEVGRRDFERSLPDAYQCPLRVRSRHSATSERCPREKREQKKSGPMKDRKVILRNAQIVFRARLQRTPEHTFVLDQCL